MTPNDHLVVTVHGIRTYGQWQSRLTHLLEDAEPGITVKNAKYGYFSILAFIFPPTRWLVTRRFRRQLLNVMQSHSWSRIDLVGHSFGTHLLAWALFAIAKERKIRIHTIVLAGSVLKSGFPWDQLIGVSVTRLVNECGTKDGILLLNQLVVPFTGMAGRIGFNGMTGDNFQNRYYQFGHSDYFLKDGKLDDEFMRRAWVPLLTTDEAVREVDCREYPKGLRGTWVGMQLWALNNAEPIKVAIWMTPFVAALLFVLSLYNNAEWQRQVALSRQLAAEAGLIADQRPELLERSTLLAIESLRLHTGAEANAVLRQNVPLLPQIRSKVEDPEKINAVAISPAEDIYAIASWDSTVTLWTTSPQRRLIKLPHESNVTAIAFSADGLWLASATQGGIVRIWDLKAVWSVQPTVEYHKIETSYPIFNLAISPDGKIIAASTDDLTGNHGMLILWEHMTDKTPVELDLKGGGQSIAFSPNENIVAVGVSNFGVRVFSLASYSQLYALPHPGLSIKVAFNPRGELAAANWGTTVKLWNMRTGEEVHQFEHQLQIKELAFSPDGKWLATGASQQFFPGQLHIWSLADYQQVARMTQRDEIEALAFSPNSEFLASGSQNGATSIWTVPTGYEVSRFAPQRGAVRSVAFSPNSREVLSNSGRIAWVWEFGSPQRALNFESGYKVDLVEFSPAERRYLVWTTNDGPAFVWDGAADGLPKKIPTSLGEKLALSDEGPLLALIASESGNSIDIWNLSTGQIVSQLKDVARSIPRLWSSITALALSKDGKRIGIATTPDLAIIGTPEGNLELKGTGEVAIWDVNNRKRLAELPFDSVVEQIAFNAKGNAFAVGEKNGRVTIFDTSNMDEVKKVSSFDQNGKITGIAFTPNGNRIVTSSDQQTNRGGEHRISNVDTGMVISRTMHPDGVQFLTSNELHRSRYTMCLEG